ncbi:MAG: polysaccharide deacetylase family protein [Planctomycetota bacterium]|jgi:peptidoglycan/xylan/chitin deacetylase (PgdA/CDA1 family)
MMDRKTSPLTTRRQWLAGSLATGVAASGVLEACYAQASEKKGARIAITLDLEMSRNFPTWETTHWDYEKGNLDEPTKRYASEAAKRVRERGGVIHFFVVGQVFEQANVDWLRDIAEAGHPIGNHTYDHINVLATRREDLQFRFQRAPWLLPDHAIIDLIRENIERTSKAMQSRIGILPQGFRTPGGFHDGLRNHPEVRSLLKDLGYRWASSLYPAHPNTDPRQEPSDSILDAIASAQKASQPFTYPDGLIEIPMSPISDIGAFRTGRWKLEWFLRSVERSVRWAIDRAAAFDFLAHPSCLGVMDPEFKTLDLICRLVEESKDRAELTDLNAIATG